jgi:hypothetical protein
MDDKQLIVLRRAQNRLLMLALVRPGLRRFTDYVSEDMLPDESARKLLTFLRNNPKFDGKDPQDVAALRPIEDYVKIMLAVYDEEHYQDVEDIDLESGASRQQVVIVEQYVKTKSQNIEAMYQAGDDEQRARLDQERDQLARLISRAKNLIA